MQTIEYRTESQLTSGLSRALASGRDVLVHHANASRVTLDFGKSVCEGLDEPVRRLDCRFLYDDLGSRLYESICQQPEYYLTRTEDVLLERYSEAIRTRTGPARLLELGSGNAEKCGHLLNAWTARSPRVTYMPVDVSDSALRKAILTHGKDNERVHAVGIHATYDQVLPLLAETSPALVMFLGSTIGNFSPNDAQRFWQAVAGGLRAGDHFLLGVDLVKDPALLEAAYDDAAGVTRAFTLNLFHRMNRELDAGVDVGRVDHVARFNERDEQIEIHARFETAQRIDVRSMDRHFVVCAGEEILVEISRKFRLETLTPYLERFGFDVVETFTDERAWFALLLLQRRSHADERSER
jgi:L-histidine Nalpha-methyltransferase